MRDDFVKALAEGGEKMRVGTSELLSILVIALVFLAAVGCLGKAVGTSLREFNRRDARER